MHTMESLYPSLDVVSNIAQFADAIGVHENKLGISDDIIIPPDEIPVTSIVTVEGPKIYPNLEPDLISNSPQLVAPAVKSIIEARPIREDLDNLLAKHPNWTIVENEDGSFRIFNKETMLLSPTASKQLTPSQVDDPINHVDPPIIKNIDSIVKFKNLKGAWKSYDVSDVLSIDQIAGLNEVQLKKLYRSTMKSKKGITWVQLHLL